MTTYISALVMLLSACFCFSEAFSPPVLTVVCHGYKDHIMCNPPQRINIISAMWGRKEKDVCGLGSKVCEKDVKSIVQRICDTQTYCALTANTVDLPNYCRDTKKYLEVIHKCV